MNINIINNGVIIDKFALNMSLNESIKYLKDVYRGCKLDIGLNEIFIKVVD